MNNKTRILRLTAITLALACLSGCANYHLPGYLGSGKPLPDNTLGRYRVNQPPSPITGYSYAYPPYRHHNRCQGHRWHHRRPWHQRPYGAWGGYWH